MGHTRSRPRALTLDLGRAPLPGLGPSVARLSWATPARNFLDELENPNRPSLSATGRYARGNVAFALGRPMHCVVFVGDKEHLFGMFTQLWRVIENRTLIVVETDR